MFRWLGTMLCTSDLRFGKRMGAGSSGSSRSWGVTLGGEHVSRDGTLRVIVTVNANVNAKRRERAHL